ncbi:MAG: hypothetical protein AAGM38_10535 [Pseudomonadota bacterium]
MAARALPKAGHVADFVLLALGAAARPGAILALIYAQMDFSAGLIRLNPPARTQNKKLRPNVRIPTLIAEHFASRQQPAHAPVVAFNGAHVKSLKTAWRRLR